MNGYAYEEGIAKHSLHDPMQLPLRSKWDSSAKMKGPPMAGWLESIPFQGRLRSHQRRRCQIAHHEAEQMGQDLSQSLHQIPTAAGVLDGFGRTAQHGVDLPVKLIPIGMTITRALGLFEMIQLERSIS
jgi:hypothetical protein